MLAAFTKRMKCGHGFRVKMAESLHAIALDVEINRVPVNAATGLGVWKWTIARDYTCYILHTQLGLRHTIEMMSF